MHPKLLHDFNLTTIKSIRKSLLEWYDVEKRDLPWRKPFKEEWTGEEISQRSYEVWVSEIMLQQTQVATVISYYEKWMNKWPTIQDLSQASIESVNEVWAGLGYYSRAKRLLKGAQLAVNKFNGRLPTDCDSLIKEIPGIGRYTGGAITSIAYNHASPIVDGNVIRVVSRLRGIRADPKSKMAMELFWSLSEQMVDEKRPGDYNQGLMDLGATVCTPKNANCEACPLQQYCLAYAFENGTLEYPQEAMLTKNESCDVCLPDIEDIISVHSFPAKASKKEQRQEECITCVIELKGKDEIVSPDQRKYLLIKNPDSGLHAGLWDFPKQVFGPNDGDESCAQDSQLNDGNQNRKCNSVSLKRRLGSLLNEIAFHSSSSNDAVHVGTFVHLFTHIRRTIHVYHLKVVHLEVSIAGMKEGIPKQSRQKEQRKSKEKENGLQIKWVSEVDMLENTGVPTTLKKAFGLVKSHETPNQKKRKNPDKKSESRNSAKKKTDASQKSLLSFFKPKS